MAKFFYYRLITAFIGGAIALASVSYAQEPSSKASAKLQARFTTLPYTGRATPAQRQVQAALQRTIPLWTHQVSASFNFQMVGNSPFVAESTQQTLIKTIIIPVVLEDTQGNVLSDPTQTDACSPSMNAVDLTLGSPVFKNIVFKQGVRLGRGQYVSLFQRGSFFAQTNSLGVNPDYQVTLRPSLKSAFIYNKQSPVALASTNCGTTLWGIDINTWDSFVQNTIFPQLGLAPTTFPLFLFYNVVLYENSTNNCCILGYHSAFDNPKFGNTFQTYGIANYDASGDFSGVGDVSALSHEVAEWMDDPSTNNPTPPWGHIGQVSGCQGNLEVGDPLSGTIFPIAMPNGITYHVQDLAFWPWFFDKPAPFKVRRQPWYSMYGTFKTDAASCS